MPIYDKPVRLLMKDLSFRLLLRQPDKCRPVSCVKLLFLRKNRVMIPVDPV